VWCLNGLPNTNELEIISGSWDHSIKLWDLKKGQCLKTLESHSNWINCLLILKSTPDELISGSCDKTIKIWSLNNGKCKKTLKDGDKNAGIDYGDSINSLMHFNY